jgi:hypothetical protein
MMLKLKPIKHTEMIAFSYYISEIICTIFPVFYTIFDHFLSDIKKNDEFFIDRVIPSVNFNMPVFSIFAQ